MASSKFAPISNDSTSLEELDNLDLEIHVPKQTSIEKIGGIYCHICNTTFGNKKLFDEHYNQHDTGDKKIIYTCVECKMQTSKYPSFRGHCYLRHVVMNKFQCEYCPKKFNKLALLHYHVAAVHDYSCRSCKDKFTSKRDLEIHKKLIHIDLKGKANKAPYDCLLCDTVIKTVDKCESHIDDHSEILYPCPICKEILPSKLAATKHLTKHFDEKLPNDISADPNCGEDSSIDILGGVLCCICDLLCRDRTEIELHFKSNHREKAIIYTCNVCKKPFEKYELFGSHCYDHFAKGKFECDQCEKSFSRLCKLVIHTEAFHTDCLPDKPFGCEKCGHGYMTSARLKEHLRIVHDEDGSLSRCMKPGCTEIFDKPRDLIQHLKNHNPMLDNWCKLCGLQFTSLSSAEKHLHVHRQTQYTCPICKRTYNEKCFLVKHLPAHFEAVLHICTTCGKSYTARRRLIYHLKSHSETRSYKCTHCNKSFMKPSQLKQHLNTHTGRKPYSCTICPKTFSNYPNWSKHLNRIHAVDKVKIKQLHAELKTELGEPLKINTVSERTESSIQSTKSKLLDVCSFADFDGSAINDTVKALIDSLDENLGQKDYDIKETKYTTKSKIITVNIAEENLDDRNAIEAVVEDIDAMSREIEAVNHDESSDGISELEHAGILQYAELMPVDDTEFNKETTCSSRPEVPYRSFLPEPGPDFFSESLFNLDDHILPHINPMLIIKTKNNAKTYVQNLNNCNVNDVTSPLDYGTRDDWPLPTITKLFNFEENNDVNNMYIY